MEEILWSRLLSTNRIEKLHSSGGVQSNGPLKSSFIRLTAFTPTPKFKQMRTHNFHTTSAVVQNIQYPSADTAAEVGVENKGLLIGQERPTLRRSCSEGQLSGSKIAGIRDGASQETTRLLSSDPYRDPSPCSCATAIEPNYTETNNEAPHIPLSYQIPEEAKRKALLAPDNSLAACWHHSLYRGPNGEKVKVHYCKSKETTERVAQYFLNQEVIGFDIEWKPNCRATDGVKDNVSLIQLASEERVALFHIAQYQKHDTLEDLVAPTLKLIMEDPGITKVGVAVQGDCTRLRKFLGVDSRGLFELSHLYRQVEAASTGVGMASRRLVSLARQVEEHLQLPLWKGEVRSSDWTKELKLEQIMYAASDSYAGLRLYDILEGKRKALRPTPPRPSPAELNLPIILPGRLVIQTYEDPIEDECIDNNTVVEGASYKNTTMDIKASPEQGGSSTACKIPVEIPEKPSQVLAAEQWAAEWRDSLPRSQIPRTTKPYLRAYALWHHSGMSVEDVANVLRDPPLQSSTVTNYILESIRLEKLPYDEIRIKDVLKHIPESIAKIRYRSIRALVG
ncbi:hypothetical protein FGG08_003637 [Glutinoglossum americanum]|uniref:3'-5' exonuclease domain-containing protein n=1 Tax=Glutinoglossum americanum TaxID=1670608 RepID=A0A9P8HXW5_9PEZI|nr:hypothetical protein FGG08_003637 [Glutinoglossum americanum]